MRDIALFFACFVLSTVVSAPGGDSQAESQAAIKASLIGQIQTMGIDWADVPPYIESVELLHRNGEALKELLPHEDLKVSDPRRHYVLVAGVLACLVEYLNSNCTPPDYEHEFLPAVDVLLPIVWKDPRAAVAKLEGFLDDAVDIVKMVEILAKTHCGNVSVDTCNAILHVINSKTDVYNDAMELLILVGEMFEIYEESRFDQAAANYNAVGLLLNGQEELRPLVFKAAEVYDRIYGKNCQP